MPAKPFPLLLATLLLTIAPPQLPARHTLAAAPGTNADLEFLRPLLAGKRVVQLGEDGHGMRESNEIKVRMMKFLVEQMGFRIVAFESSLYLAFEADRRAASAGPQSTLIAGVLGVWHTQELLPLFESIASGAPGRPRLAGFDVQPIGSNKKRRPEFFRELPSPLREREDSATTGGVPGRDCPLDGWMAEAGVWPEPVHRRDSGA